MLHNRKGPTGANRWALTKPKWKSSILPPVPPEGKLFRLELISACRWVVAVGHPRMLGLETEAK